MGPLTIIEDVLRTLFGESTPLDVPLLTELRYAVRLEEDDVLRTISFGSCFDCIKYHFKQKI